MTLTTQEQESRSSRNVDSLAASFSSRESRANAVALTLAEFVRREQREPMLVEIRTAITQSLGRAGSLSIGESEVLIRELQALIDSNERDRREADLLRSVVEIIFHHYPNSMNASPS